MSEKFIRAARELMHDGKNKYELYQIIDIVYDNEQKKVDLSKIKENESKTQIDLETVVIEDENKVERPELVEAFNFAWQQFKDKKDI